MQESRISLVRKDLFALLSCACAACACACPWSCAGSVYSGSWYLTGMVLVTGVMRIWPPPPWGCDTLMGAGTVLPRECLATSGSTWKPDREPLQPSPFTAPALSGGLRRPLEAS